MPRTTVNLDPSVLGELKRRAKDEGKSLGEVITEIVAAADLARNPEPDRREFHWHSQNMGANVDLEDKEAVRRALDDQ